MNISSLKNAVVDSIRRNDIIIELTTTSKCNCHCEYCFECGDQQDQPASVSQKLLNELIDYCNQFDISKYKHLIITFWGGEPFLNVDLILSIVEATSKFDFVLWRAYSNGTQFEKYKQLVSLLEKNDANQRFQIQLSYDGEPHHHAKRKYSGQIVIDAAKYLFDHHIDISFKATLTFDMLDNLEQIWDSYFKLYQMFGNLVTYSPTLDMTKTSRQYLDSWIKNMMKIAKKEHHFFLCTGRNLMSFFSGNQKKICNINNSISIDVDGSIYRCHGCFYEKSKDDLLIGNIFNINPINDAISKNIVDVEHIPIECAMCEAPYCAVCHVKYVDAMDVFKDWANCVKKDTIRCEYFKEFARIFRAYRLAIHKVNK